ncbi:MAG: cadmium-translocating P-type ATPase [Deltaproteobacteria bacterium]|nr:cadmium-translocating P-type ATPase [Deltaproteobacteria bacterium]
MSTSRFHVPAMDCATEKDIIANRLERLPEVTRLDFDILDRIVTVTHAEGAESLIEAALGDIGMAPKLLGDERSTARESLAQGTAWTRGAWLLIGSGVAATASEIVAWVSGEESSIPVIALAVLAMLLGGPSTFKKGVVALRTFTLNINLLMLIAVTGAMVIGQWPEAAMVTFLFALAELIEARSLDRARNAIRSLMALAPETARVFREGGWSEVPAAEVKPGWRVQVPPGERVPLDGKIVLGASAIDQAPITGESIPVDKAVGDPVFAGTINGPGLLEIEVTAGQGDTTLARIARTIREAQGQKAPTERFVDRFARIYTPAVLVLAFFVAFLLPVITNTELYPWVYKALVLLVIACPCALVISTPVTVVSALAAAARRGILVKGGVHLEGAKDLRFLALDKTGTLTEGRPSLTDIVPLGGTPRDELLQLAASLEATSTHPLAQAVARGWKGALLPVSWVRNQVGRGLEGKVDGQPVSIGSHRFAEEMKVCGPEVERELARLEADGKSVMIVWSGSRVLGVLGVADTLRQTSIEAIRELHALEIKVAMLTGDNPTTAAAVGREVGIDEVNADLLPEQKLAIIERLVKEHGSVGMVGDGVNDAPALARASIGFAMGAAGTDTALETADVALMKDDLRGIPELVRLSRATGRTLQTNIALSIGIKAVFFVLALFGVATLWMAVFADMGASLIVAANGLRLLRFGKEPVRAEVAGHDHTGHDHAHEHPNRAHGG